MASPEEAQTDLDGCCGRSLGLWLRVDVAAASIFYDFAGTFVDEDSVLKLDLELAETNG